MCWGKAVCSSFVFFLFSCVYVPRVIADSGNRVRPPIRSVAGSGHGCPCPYDQIVRQNGNVYKCGGWSAWSKPGGAYPTCFYSDVNNKILGNYEFMDFVDNTQLECAYNYPVCRVLW